ncbi:MAG: diphthine--ammonia ligase [Candidatus Micrarchaeota archaeon]|nr:diphthine--ammonia ligase [Candidatus Micrarchaeota archaeon]
MRLCALYSGGKDSHLAMCHYREHIQCLLTILPKSNESYMYHSLNLDHVRLHAELMGLPHEVAVQEEDDELKVLEKTLKSLKEKYNLTGIVAGATQSTYQNTRIKAIADHLGLEVKTPLWQISPEDYLERYHRYNMKAIVVGVFAYPLDQSYLGRVYDEELVKELLSYNINPFGEGGEIETYTVKSDCLGKEIEILEYEIEGKHNTWRMYLKRLGVKDI